MFKKCFVSVLETRYCNVRRHNTVFHLYSLSRDGEFKFRLSDGWTAIRKSELNKIEFRQLQKLISNILKIVEKFLK